MKQAVKQAIKHATAIKEAVPVVTACCIEGTYIIETDCIDYDVYRTLPTAVKYEVDGVTRVYAKTGWNSDHGRAYYQTGRSFAVAVAAVAAVAAVTTVAAG